MRAEAVRAPDRAREGLSPGDRIASRYTIVRALGRGGMATVYEVTDASRGRSAALKVLSREMSEHEPLRLRFRREFHTLARLVHPRIVEVYEFGAADGAPFYTMELLGGQDLRDLGRLAPDRACALLHDVASAIGFLHARRLLHRDLAPRNVRCTEDGRAKLIDFGVLSTFGVSEDIAGTPPIIAPEVVRGVPLDHRADLFSLGALAYYVLTGTHAYPATGIAELEELWRVRPRPPSALAPDVPKALDELVLMLLSLDPLARPSSAAEVMDRLAAIGGRVAAVDHDIAHAYLASAALVGRRGEMRLLKRWLGKATEGVGGAVVLRAPSGTGKTRLLREVGVEAQLLGLSVARASCEPTAHAPYGTLRELTRSLLAVAPRAMDVLQASGPLLARVLPELRARGVEAAATTEEPSEERLRVQAEIVEWLRRVAAAGPVAILVDDVQRADEASAAVLAAIAQAARGLRLVVVLALRTDEPARAAIAVNGLVAACRTIRLRGLEADDVDALVGEWFGELPQRARLARWMHKTAAGSPLHCHELAQHLVDQGIVRHAGGLWSVPDEARLESMPVGLSAALAARLGCLSAPALAFAEALSIHGGELPLSLAVHLAGAGREADAFRALDELIEHDFVVGTGERYRFRHDALREALLARLEPDARRRLHLRVGLALQEEGVATAGREAEIGWHLLEGGEARAGAELLRRAGYAAYEAGSLDDALGPLEAALRVYDEAGIEPALRLELRHLLVKVGCMGDHEVALRYAHDAIEGYAPLAGIPTAEKLAPYVGRVAALSMGLAWAGAKRLLVPKAARGPGPIDALQRYCLDVTYLATVHVMQRRLDELPDLVRRLEPTAIGKGTLIYATYDYVSTCIPMQLGHWDQAERVTLEILHAIDHDKITPFSEIERKTARCGVQCSLAIMDLMRQRPSFEEHLAAVERLGVPSLEATAKGVRLLAHRYRGEEERAREIEVVIEQLAMRAGTMRGLEVLLIWHSAVAYGLTRDVLGLRRSVEALERLGRTSPRFAAHAELARGEYLRERGHVAASRDALSKALEAIPEEDALVRPLIFAAMADTELADNDPDAAEAFAGRAERDAWLPGREQILWKLRAARTRALANAALGRVDEAVASLDRALADAAPTANPTLCGTLHEARARIAIHAGDRLAYMVHRSETARWLAPTRNPALIALLHKLERADRTESAARSVFAGSEQPTAAPASSRTTAPDATTVLTSDAAIAGDEAGQLSWISVAIGECRGRVDRAERALELLVDAFAGESGFLYLKREQGPVLAAPRSGAIAPPEELAAVLERMIAGTIVDLQGVEGDDEPESSVRWRPVLLGVTAGRGQTVVGAVGILGGKAPLREPDAGVVERIARELYLAGDAVTG